MQCDRCGRHSQPGVGLRRPRRDVRTDRRALRRRGAGGDGTGRGARPHGGRSGACGGRGRMSPRRRGRRRRHRQRRRHGRPGARHSPRGAPDGHAQPFCEGPRAPARPCGSRPGRRAGDRAPGGRGPGERPGLPQQFEHRRLSPGRGAPAPVGVHRPGQVGGGPLGVTGGAAAPAVHGRPDPDRRRDGRPPHAVRVRGQQRIPHGGPRRRPRASRSPAGGWRCT